MSSLQKSDLAIRAPAFFLDLLFPRLCAVCGERLITGEDALCLPCLSDLPKTHFVHAADNPVARMFWGKFPFELATSFLVFEKGNMAQQIIHGIKYHNHSALAVKMGIMTGSYLTTFAHFASVDYLLPVPLHKRKKRKRGFNQSERIALGISRQTGKPVLKNVLTRKHHNPTQTHKGRYERWENVADIFNLTNLKMAKGKHLMIIDDVITTGATIEACVQTLLRIPDIKISIASLAVAL